jgi:hypothetical protein
MHMQAAMIADLNASRQPIPAVRDGLCQGLRSRSDGTHQSPSKAVRYRLRPISSFMISLVPP